MTEHEDTLYLRDMLECANRAIEISGGMRRSDLQDLDTQTLALRKLLEIIGEASRRISVGFREKYPFIEWKSIAGLRDRLVHGYDTIDYNVLWDTCVLDLPPLAAKLERVLRDEPGE